MKMKKIPKFLKKYFWDVAFEKLNLETHPEFILERILEYGDEKAVKWMKETFSRDEIANILFHFRGISPKTANYWALIYDIDKRKVLCLQKQYLKTQRKHWNY